MFVRCSYALQPVVFKYLSEVILKLSELNVH